MASLGHVAVGMLAGRTLSPDAKWRAVVPMAVFSGLSLLPDLDYVGVMAGLANSGPCGHRGASHSLALPLAVSALAFALAPRLRQPRWRLAILSGITVASHSVLDAMTTGGRGVPFFWPLTFARFDMPWRPLPDAPCGLEYLSADGLRVALIELALFLPFVVLALRPRRRVAPAATAIETGPVTVQPHRPNRITQQAV